MIPHHHQRCKQTKSYQSNRISLKKTENFGNTMTKMEKKFTVMFTNEKWLVAVRVLWCRM